MRVIDSFLCTCRKDRSRRTYRVPPLDRARTHPLRRGSTWTPEAALYKGSRRHCFLDWIPPLIPNSETEISARTQPTTPRDASVAGPKKTLHPLEAIGIPESPVHCGVAAVHRLWSSRGGRCALFHGCAALSTLVAEPGAILSAAPAWCCSETFHDAAAQNGRDARRQAA